MTASAAGPQSAAKPSLYEESGLRRNGGRFRAAQAVTIGGMFSYRHAFHAGNHADVLKHTVLIATLEHLLEKDTALTVVDTHAGAGLYRLDGDYAGTSGEAAEGVLRLLADPKAAAADGRPPRRAAENRQKAAPSRSLADALARYLEVVARLQPQRAAPRSTPARPSSPSTCCASSDKLKLFELHPTDARTLAANIAQLEAGRQIARAARRRLRQRHKFLPPPSRRALVLCDPSYEIKSDYARVLDFMAEALKRFATGTYAVWYPIIPRPEAHDLPRRLKTLATKAGKPWLHATLTVKSSKITTDATGDAPAGPPGQRHVPDQSALHAEAAAGGGPAADGRAAGAGPQRHPFARQRRLGLSAACAAAGTCAPPASAPVAALPGAGVIGRADFRAAAAVAVLVGDRQRHLLMPMPSMPISSAAARLRSMMRPEA